MSYPPTDPPPESLPLKSISCTGPLQRRDFLQAGALALGGLTLPQVLAGRAAAGTSQLDTSVIMLYLHGGPSQLETYDLKPQASTEYRSLFQPIPTNVPGMDICELFPLQAKLADKFSLVRSLHHDIGIHSDGGIIVLTGKRPSKLDPTSRSTSEHPDYGSIASKVRGYSQRSMPPYVAIPGRPYMTTPTYLGLSHSAFEIGHPTASGFSVPHLKRVAGLSGEGLTNRRGLLQQFDRFRAGMDQRGSVAAMDEFRSVAFQMLGSPEVADAFDLSREAATLRERYGNHRWGQGCLLARRLAEAGTAVVTMFLDDPITGPEYTNWDDHIGNAGRPGHFADFMARRLPYLDQALSALIEDIFARSLDRRILVLVVGEFGRTPRISHNSMGIGRDHWPQAYTALFSGGGLKMGQVVGATNSKAEFPTASPYTPFDMLATIYHHLGIDRNASFPDFAGRPISILNNGDPIKELI